MAETTKHGKISILNVKRFEPTMLTRILWIMNIPENFECNVVVVTFVISFENSYT